MLNHSLFSHRQFRYLGAFYLHSVTRLFAVALFQLFNGLYIFQSLRGFGFEFNEALSFIRIIGIVTALAAFWLTFYRKDKSKAKLKYLFLPLLLFIGNGSNDSLLKISQELYITDDYTMFLATAFSTSLLLGLLIIIGRTFIKKRKIEIKNIIAGVILGLLNWGSTLYFLKGLSKFDVSVFIPIFNVSIVTLSALIGLFMFKEKLRTINWVGILLAITAIITIAWG